jgi:hypothetical protein
MIFWNVEKGGILYLFLKPGSFSRMPVIPAKAGIQIFFLQKRPDARPHLHGAGSGADMTAKFPDPLCIYFRNFLILHK